MTWDGNDRRRGHDLESLIEKAVSRVADDTVKRAVPIATKETLQLFGFDTEDPIGIQEDMAFLRESRQRCQRFWRTFYDTIFSSLIKWGAVVFLLGLAVWLGLDFQKLIP